MLGWKGWGKDADGTAGSAPGEVLEEGRILSYGMKHSFAEQRKASLPIALSFDQFQLGHIRVSGHSQLCLSRMGWETPLAVQKNRKSPILRAGLSKVRKGYRDKCPLRRSSLASCILGLNN